MLIPLPRRDFDPTEVAVPWQVLTRAGHAVVFATPDGRAGQADAHMLEGTGLGPWKTLLRADARGREAYQQMERSEAFRQPLRYNQLDDLAFDGLVLPGGHAKGVREYLESTRLQALVVRAFAADRPVGAICHGVVLAARARLADGRSVLHGRRTTALTRSMELSAWAMTVLWLGDYYRTYPLTVQAEVRAALAAPGDFLAGPLPLRRDSPDDLGAGFVVRDGNYLSARWPGDAHRFAAQFEVMLRERDPATSPRPRDPAAAASSRPRC